LLQSGEFNRLRIFVTVAEVLSFSRAAELLGMSPSAVSQALRGLEERIGVRLLNRTTRSVALTETGTCLYERVKPAMRALGEATSEARRAQGRPAGLVRIHAFHTACERFVTPILASFAEACPDITLDITVDDAVVDLVAGGFDAAIRIGEVIERDLVAMKLGPDLRMIAVASPGYLAHNGRPETPRDLLRHRCIRWRWPGNDLPYRWEFCEDGRWFEIAVEGPLIANSKALNHQAALDGVGIGFAETGSLAAFIADGRLVPLLERWSAPFPGFYLCYPRQRQMAPALRAFIDAVRAGSREAKMRLPD
ncbi:MAG TPA: LysR family transcriptional regulator, partial [Acidiphilium sp.]